MEKLIEISGLSKAYGKKQALHNVDMVFEGGRSSVCSVLTEVERQRF